MTPCPYGHAGPFDGYRQAGRGRRCGECHRLKQVARRHGLPPRAYLLAPVPDPDDYADARSDVRTGP